MIHTDPTLSVAERIDAVCDHFENEWKAGRNPQIDDFVASVPESERDILSLALNDIQKELQQKQQGSPNLIPTMLQPLGESSVATIGRFKILGTLGEGGFGKVYRAFDSELNREVALKVPLETSIQDSNEKARFLKEARAAGTINHPNVCQIFEVGEADNRPYIVMALVPGQSLAETIKGRKDPLHTKQIALIVRKIAIALSAAHEKGIVHRDLKPANVMFDRDRKDIVVMDFGLARGPKLSEAVGTQSGVIMGTPAYMSPEQARGDSKEVGPASDIYSLGVILYELLTGTRPFTGTATEVIGQILHVEPEAPSRRRKGVDSHLEAICLKALQREPHNRHASMKAFAQAVDAFLRSPQFKSPSTETAQTEKTQQNDTEEDSQSVQMSEVFAALSMDRKQIREETEQAVNAALAKHRFPLWILVGVSGVAIALLVAVTLIFFVKSKPKTNPAVTVAVMLDLKDVDLNDKTLSFFLDNKPISSAELLLPVELTPGEHTLHINRQETLLKEIIFLVTGGDSPGIQVKLKRDVRPPKPVIKKSPLDVLDPSEIPDSILNKVYGGREKAPKELVALYPNIGAQDPRDDYHTFDINSEGLVLASAGYPWDMIVMWNLATGKRFVEFGIEEPRGSPFFIWGKFAPNSWFYGLRQNQKLYAYNEKGGIEWTDRVRENWSFPSLAPDGKTLVVGDETDKTLLKILDAKTGQVLKKLDKFTSNPVTRPQHSPDGKTFVVLTPKTMNILDAKEGTLTRSFAIEKGGHAPVFSADGKKVFASVHWKQVEDYFIEIDLQTEKLREYRLPRSGCRNVTVNPVFPILASSDTSGNLHFWDAELGPEQTPYILRIGKEVERMVFTPEGKYLVVGSDNGVMVFRLPVEKGIQDWKEKKKP